MTEICIIYQKRKEKTLFFSLYLLWQWGLAVPRWCQRLACHCSLREFTFVLFADLTWASHYYAFILYLYLLQDMVKLLASEWVREGYSIGIVFTFILYFISQPVSSLSCPPIPFHPPPLCPAIHSSCEHQIHKIIILFIVWIVLLFYIILE